VLLVTDATAVGADVYERVVAALAATAQTWRAAGRSFFAVMVDADGTLALPPLYHEKPG
jgi:hypothetical protein